MGVSGKGLAPGSAGSGGHGMRGLIAARAKSVKTDRIGGRRCEESTHQSRKEVFEALIDLSISLVVWIDGQGLVERQPGIASIELQNVHHRQVAPGRRRAAVELDDSLSIGFGIAGAIQLTGGRRSSP